MKILILDNYDSFTFNLYQYCGEVLSKFSSKEDYTILVKRNDEVLMPSLNFVASANAVNYCNAVPHFVEIEESTLGVNPIKLKEYFLKNISLIQLVLFLKKK